MIPGILQMLAGIGASFAAVAGAAADDLAAIKERGVLRVGVAEIAPFVINTGLGDPIGFEADATALLAERLGVSREFVIAPFGELAYSLRDGRFDIIASGYSMSDERREIIDFSLPYNETAYKLVVSTTGSEGRTKLRQFNDRRLKIGYVLGGLSGDVAKATFGKATLVPFERRGDGLRAMVDGDIDGFVGGDPFAAAVIAAKPGAFSVPIEAPLATSIEAFGVRKGEEALLDEINAFVVEQEEMGTFDALHAKWFVDLLPLSVMHDMRAPPPDDAPVTTTEP